MPRTGSLLTAEERTEFGAWLRAAIDASPKSKSSIVKDLNANTESTSRVNMYRSGARIPTVKVAVRLALALGEEPFTVLLRAGHYREVIGFIDSIVRARNVPQEVKDEFVRLALRAFPLGGSATTLTDQFMGEPALRPLTAILDENVFLKAAGLVRDPMLKRAVRALSDLLVRPWVRRKIAADFVNEWALNVAPHIYAESQGFQNLRGPLASAKFAKDRNLEGPQKS